MKFYRRKPDLVRY